MSSTANRMSVVPTFSAPRPVANSAARSVTFSRTSGPNGGVPWPFGLVLLAAGHERGLAHAQCLEGRAHLSMEAHGAKPALRFVLRGMGERNGSSHKCDHKGCVL